jgi:UDP-N-acetylmuramate dehydrogenase
MIERKDSVLIAESGASLPALAKTAAREGYTGFEFLIGIPGTVGGGIVMNAGLTVFRPREIAQVLVDFDTISVNGLQETLTAKDVHMGYRSSELQMGDRLVTKARFQLSEKGDPGEIRQASIEHHRERKSKQPLDKPTAGSTFKSPPGRKGAGYYIEKAGLKGHQIGGAVVSDKHANWIENSGEATSEDIQTLIEFIRKKVQEEHDVFLEVEVKIVI